MCCRRKRRQRELCARARRFPRGAIAIERADDGECPAEHVARLTQIGNLLDRKRDVTQSRGGGQQMRAPDCGEHRKAFVLAPHPSLGDQLGADSRRVAQR